MTQGPIRIYERGHLHFVTFSCYQRRAFLGSVPARNIFVQILDTVRNRHGFALVGYVVTPEHVHLLIGEPRRGSPSTVLQALKQSVSRRLSQNRQVLRQQTEVHFEDHTESLPRFWQRRFYDFNVWSLKKRIEKLDYMHMNPLKRGLVAHPRDWPWSSFSSYAKSTQPLIRIDPVR